MDSPGARRGQRFSGINVTPMADIMIVLIVIFLAVTVLMDAGIPVTLPKATTAKKTQPRRLTVEVTKDLHTLFNHIAVRSEQELEGRLRAELLLQPEGDRVVFLRADAGLPYAEVGKVLAACHRAGADEITLVTAKKS